MVQLIDNKRIVSTDFCSVSTLIISRTTTHIHTCEKRWLSYPGQSEQNSCRSHCISYKLFSRVMSPSTFQIITTQQSHINCSLRKLDLTIYNIFSFSKPLSKLTCLFYLSFAYILSQIWSFVETSLPVIVVDFILLKMRENTVCLLGIYVLNWSRSSSVQSYLCFTSV